MKINFEELIERLKTGEDCTNFPVNGNSPFGDSWPTGVWSWDEQQQLVLIGSCADDAEVISYAEARKYYK